MLYFKTGIEDDNQCVAHQAKGTSPFFSLVEEVPQKHDDDQLLIEHLFGNGALRQAEKKIEKQKMPPPPADQEQESIAHTFRIII